MNKLLLTLMILIMSVNLYATRFTNLAELQRNGFQRSNVEIIDQSFPGSLSDILPDDQKMKLYDIAVDRVIRQVVPIEYQESLITLNTGEDIVFKEAFLALALNESGGFKYLESIHPNEDWSVDKGPFGLNSDNIKDADFIRACCIRK